MTIQELHSAKTASRKPRLSILVPIYWHLRIWGVPPSQIGKRDFTGKKMD